MGLFDLDALLPPKGGASGGRIVLNGRSTRDKAAKMGGDWDNDEEYSSLEAYYLEHASRAKESTVTTTYYSEKCAHKGDDVILQVGNVTFGGATGKSIPWSTPADLIVDCAGEARRFDSSHKFPLKYNKLRSFVSDEIERIEISWSDGAAPPLQRKFFEELPKVVGRGHVVFNCIGGHGRTGTALAAMLIVHQKMSACEAIETVRKMHCENAIETNAQVQWLCDLAGLGERVLKPPPPPPVVTPPAKTTTTTTSTTTSSTPSSTPTSTETKTTSSAPAHSVTPPVSSVMVPPATSSSHLQLASVPKPKPKS